MQKADCAVIFVGGNEETTMKPQRFVISWLLAVLIMLVCSYVWHGVILNDFRSISYNFGLFAALTVMVYALIGFVLNVLLNYLHFSENPFTKRVLLGSAFGFFIYLIVFTLGISYHARGIEHVVIDFSWQMLEQGIGAFVIAFCMRVFERIDAIAEA